MNELFAWAEQKATCLGVVLEIGDRARLRSNNWRKAGVSAAT